MKNIKNVAIVVVLLVAVAAVIAVKQSRRKVDAAVQQETPEPALTPAATVQTALPRMVDLGTDKCIPCKMMAPILEELKKTYAGQLQVEFIDVWKDRGASVQFGIQVIPTQIFYSSDGKELFRHEGYFSREDILGQWAKLGITLNEPEAQ